MIHKIPNIYDSVKDKYTPYVPEKRVVTKPSKEEVEPIKNKKINIYI